MHKSTVILLLLCIHSPSMTVTQKPTPDLSITLSKKALDFLLGETQKILDRQLATLKLPAASQQIEDGSVEVHDVKLTKFIPPTYFYDLESPHTLVWGLNDASLFVDGQWSGQKKIILPSLKLPSLKGSGGFEAQLEQLSLLLKAQLGKNESSGLTKIDNFQCNASIANLTTKAVGGVMGYVLNIFRSTVSAKVKPLLEEAICNQMERLIEQDVDQDLLQKLPTKYEVGRKFVLTVSMANAPAVDDPVGYIRLDHNVGLVYDGKDETAAYGAANQANFGTPAPLAPPLDRMIYVRTSEKPANMLLYTMHTKNMTTYIIDEYSGQQTADYLRLDCPAQENCLGHSLEGISAIYPPPAKGAFRVYTSRTPSIRFDQGTADLVIPLVMEINARTGPPQYAEDNLLMADVDMASTVHFTLDKSGKKLSGFWKVYKFELTTRPLGVAKLVKVDNKKLGDSLKGFIADQGNRMLADGIDVPVAITFVPGYQLTNVDLKILPQVMQFEADMAIQQMFRTNF